MALAAAVSTLVGLDVVSAGGGFMWHSGGSHPPFEVVAAVDPLHAGRAASVTTNDAASLR